MDFDITVSYMSLCIRPCPSSKGYMALRDLSRKDSSSTSCNTCFKALTSSILRTIYQSRKLKHPERHAFGLPVLCDFGEARVGRRFSYEEIQPEVYRAPEILLQMEWNHMVDIWNVARVVSRTESSYMAIRILTPDVGLGYDSGTASVR